MMVERRGVELSPPPGYEPGVLPLHYTSGTARQEIEGLGRLVLVLVGGLGGVEAQVQPRRRDLLDNLTCMTTCG